MNIEQSKLTSALKDRLIEIYGVEENELEALRVAIIKDYQQSTEYEAMKADAERYRAIRCFGNGMRVVFGNYPNINIHDVKNNLCGDALDQAIDQARKI